MSILMHDIFWPPSRTYGSGIYLSLLYDLKCTNSPWFPHCYAVNKLWSLDQAFLKLEKHSDHIPIVWTVQRPVDQKTHHLYLPCYTDNDKKNTMIWFKVWKERCFQLPSQEFFTYLCQERLRDVKDKSLHLSYLFHARSLQLTARCKMLSNMTLFCTYIQAQLVTWIRKNIHTEFHFSFPTNASNVNC